MISYLVGQPHVQGTQLTLLVGGVGYDVHVTRSVWQAAQTRKELALHIHTHIRPESWELFGFAESSDREMFRLLLSVSGVGPRTALQILELGQPVIVAAVQQAQVSVFTRVPRVGKKLAQKIVIELKSKLGSVQELNLQPLTSAQQEVVDALLVLGYTEEVVTPLVLELVIPEQTSATSIKQVLQKLQARTVPEK